MMESFVIDTNVIVVANGRSTPTPEMSCILNSLKYLEKARVAHIVLDDQYLILNEYARQVNPSGQPGVGDAFLKWLYQNQYVEERCERVKITPNDQREFEEFPEDPALQTFDRADRKFVAVALTSSFEPQIIVSADRGWARHKDALRQNKVKFRLICEE